MPASILDQELKRVAVGMCVQRNLSHNGSIKKLFQRLQEHENQKHKEHKLVGRVPTVLKYALQFIAVQNNLSSSGSQADIYERCKRNGIISTGAIKTTIKKAQKALEAKQHEQKKKKHTIKTAQGEQTKKYADNFIWSVTAPANEVHRIMKYKPGTMCSFTNGKQAILAKGKSGFYWTSCD